MQKKNPKVLVVATSRKTRGGITSVVKAHEQGEQWKKYNCKWIETHRDSNKFIKWFYLLRALAQYIVLLPFYDLVHMHMAMGRSAKRKSIFVKIAKLLNKKIIIHFHPPGAYPHLLENGLRELYASLFQLADKVVLLSPEWKRWCKKELNIEKNLTVIYNPCNPVNLISCKKKKQILYAGSIIERKGYKDLIKAFSKIAEKYPDWKVVFAGNGEVDNGKVLAKDLKIENQVEFKGWVSGVDKEKIFSESMIYCLASYGEGFPMAVLDAWSYGLPIVTTPVGGLPDIIIEKENALIFPPKDFEYLAKQLEIMIKDEFLRTRISEKSVDLAKNTFDLGIINRQIHSLYQDLLD
jgi:glycosyltransferase involved in cell wall biosynthesis